VSFLIAGSVVALLVLLVADYRHNTYLASSAKVVTSLCLQGYALQLYLGQQTPYAKGILAGVTCGVIGDVLLISRNKSYFLAGMTAFLVGHLAYIAAFLQQPFQVMPWMLAAIFIAVVMHQVFRWIKPALQGPLLPGVASYMLVLTAMCSLGLSIRIGGQFTLIGLGALLFTMSDFFVATHRFKTPQIYDRLLGLPLYYLGQYCLVRSIETLQTNIRWLPV